MSLLIVERGNLKKDRIEIKKYPFYIGRDNDNDLVIDDELCSRKHIRLKSRGRIIVLEDLDSRNGTYVNGDRVVNRVLHSGDKILLGSIEFKFVSSFPEIHLAEDILKYDMIISDGLGFDGIKKEADDLGSDLQKWRLPELNLMKLTNFSDATYKELFNILSDISLSDDFQEVIKRILKAIGNIAKNTSRIAFFIWSNPNQQLVPVAVRHFGKKKSFLLSQRCIQDVLSRKRAIFLKDLSSPRVTYSGRNRLILPVLFQKDIVGVVHIESDVVGAGFSQYEVDFIQVLLDRVAGVLQSMLLKKELDVWFAGTLETMVAIVEAKDTYTRGHSERVSKYCMAIAEELKLDPEVRKLLMMSAMVHDIGKIGIPDAILKKASNLSGDEYEDMKMHTIIGTEILKHIPDSHRFISGVKHHHEKWDGSGYPDGLAGENIPFFGRIIAIADSFDAMISGRSYSGFLDQETALAKIKKEADNFDPEILKAFFKAAEDGLLTMKTDTQNNILPEESDDNKTQGSSTTTVREQKKNTKIDKKIEKKPVTLTDSDLDSTDLDSTDLDDFGDDLDSIYDKEQENEDSVIDKSKYLLKKDLEKTIMDIDSMNKSKGIKKK